MTKRWFFAAARIIAGTPNALTGTAGDDTFVVDSTLDTISEGANQGTDTVQSSVTWTLGDNLENLTLKDHYYVMAILKITGCAADQRTILEQRDLDDRDRGAQRLNLVTHLSSPSGCRRPARACWRS